MHSRSLEVALGYHIDHVQEAVIMATESEIVVMIVCFFAVLDAKETCGAVQRGKRESAGC